MLKAPFRAGAQDAAAGERQAAGEGVGAVEPLSFLRLLFVRH